FFFLAVLASLALLSSGRALEVSQNTVTTTTTTTSNDAAPPPAVVRKDSSVRTSSASELVKMQEAGVDASVIRAYVQTLRVPYKPTSDDILYMHDHKVPDDVISDWIKKGADLMTLAAR